MSDPTPLDPPPPAEDTPTLEHPIEDGTPCLEDELEEVFASITAVLGWGRRSR